MARLWLFAALAVVGLALSWAAMARAIWYGPGAIVEALAVGGFMVTLGAGLALGPPRTSKDGGA